jgi:hypothetical protein
LPQLPERGGVCRAARELLTSGGDNQVCLTLTLALGWVTEKRTGRAERITSQTRPSLRRLTFRSYTQVNVAGRREFNLGDILFVIPKSLTVQPPTTLSRLHDTLTSEPAKNLEDLAISGHFDYFAFPGFLRHSPYLDTPVTFVFHYEADFELPPTEFRHCMLRNREPREIRERHFGMDTERRSEPYSRSRVWCISRSTSWLSFLSGGSLLLTLWGVNGPNRPIHGSPLSCQNQDPFMTPSTLHARLFFSIQINSLSFSRINQLVRIHANDFALYHTMKRQPVASYQSSNEKTLFRFPRSFICQHLSIVCKLRRKASVLSQVNDSVCKLPRSYKSRVSSSLATSRGDQAEQRN